MSKAKEKRMLREQRIMEYMREQVRLQGYAPTVREICAALGIRSTSTVHKDIESLAAQGLIRKDPSKPRALVLTVSSDGSGQAGGTEGTEGNEAAGSLSDVEPIREDVVEVPVVGSVAAGQPILAEENIEDSFMLPARYVQGTNFMLRVRGNSMINAGIFNGDLILVEQRQEARNGEIVVAMVDGFENEATVKRFYREKGHVRLQPENDEMSPIIVEDARILGRVKGVFRYYN